MEYKEILSNWFKATKIGDYIEGTLVSKEWKEGTDPKGRPQNQEIYEVLADEGTSHVLIKKDGQKIVDEDNPLVIEKGAYYKFAKGSVVDAMKKIKVGQKVKFYFHSVIESKDKMKNDFKLVKVYGGDINADWLNGQEEFVSGAGNGGQNEVAENDGEIKVEEIPFDDPVETPATEATPVDPVVEATPTTEPVQTPEEKKAIINQLAKEKLGAEEADVMQKVMSATNLAFIDSNFDSIIKKLEEHQAA